MSDPIKLQSSKTAPPPAQLPAYGRCDPATASFIGKTNYEGALDEQKLVFGLKRADRRRHVYVLGKAGVGKSKLTELLMRQDIAYGHGFCLFDPYGSNIGSLLDFIPDQRIPDVAIINPLDVEHPIAFNPFADTTPTTRYTLAQGIVEIIAAQVGEAWRPESEHILRTACLALAEYPGACLLDLLSMLTDSEFQKKVLAHCTDPIVSAFWQQRLLAAESRAQLDHDHNSMPLINALSRFLLNPYIRPIFSQAESKLDFNSCIKEKKIVLINLAKGKLGEGNATFLGSLLLLQLKQALLSRLALPKEQRHDYYVYIDEFQDLLGETLDSLMAESRKYGVPFTLSHQYLFQLPAKDQATVLGNIGTIVTFRIGSDDAAKLKTEMAPVFDTKDLTNLGIREFYIKMVIDGEISDPFSAETLGVFPAPHPSYREDIIKHSQETYGGNPPAAL